ncbi:DUF5132 domain-containing protein [Janthinobacterium fluminis]|uniref:DUF5132 domain-containing protein n=1 Tax=Janthinobacterium fluminis TaxID=2987524 RepID=A0ABT5JVR8_9BURK|nr:DUF5132 domain-containing protein [Janthinobacterium fluminis]MDC8756525.1 DUF5132 domain-containing protein [Janthinobacterium fluminis]
MDILKSNIAVGVGAALAATVLAPVLTPVLATLGRPLAKSLIRGAMLFYEKSRETVAMAGEAMEDLIAEVRAEDAGRHGGAAARQEAAPADVAATEARPPDGGAAPPEYGVRSVGNGSAMP